MSDADRLDELEQRIEELESRPHLEGDPTNFESLEVVANGTAFPIGRVLKGKASGSLVEQLQQRLEDLENGEIDPDKALAHVDVESLPPLHQMYLSVSHGRDSALSDNQRRAAKIWPHFREYAEKSYGGLSITSTKIKDIFQRELHEEPDKPHPETIRRVMQTFEDFSDGLFELETDRNPNRLIVDVDDWDELMSQVEAGMNGSGADDSVSPETGQDEASIAPEPDQVVTAGDGGVEVGRE